MKIFCSLLLCTVPITLTACGGKPEDGGAGGGGGGGGLNLTSANRKILKHNKAPTYVSSNAANLEFPVKKAMLSAWSAQQDHELSGLGWVTAPSGDEVDVSGTLHTTISAPTSTTFEGVAAEQSELAIKSSVNIASTGDPIPVDVKRTYYYDTHHRIIGLAGRDFYCVAKKPGKYPASLKIKESGVIAKFDCYNDSTKTSHAGTAELTYKTREASATEMNYIETTTLVYPQEDMTAQSSIGYTIDQSGAVKLTSTGLRSDGPKGKMKLVSK